MGRFAEFFKEQSIPLAVQPKQKMLSLDQQFEKMEAQIQILENENLHLKAQVKPLERRIEQLQQQIENMEREAAAADDKSLDEKALALLHAIAQGFHVSDKGGETIIKGTRAQAMYYLGLLKERRLIRYITANYTIDGRYQSTQKGLEYLHKRGKL
jgi:predicted RNase H-like nuclease (RuvC/YqgF family)